jgi:hypothetical protein
VGPTVGVDGCGKSRPPPGFDPRTVQPVASHSRKRDYIVAHTANSTAFTVPICMNRLNAEQRYTHMSCTNFNQKSVGKCGEYGQKFDDALK